MRVISHGENMKITIKTGKSLLRKGGLTLRFAEQFTGVSFLLFLASIDAPLSSSIVTRLAAGNKRDKYRMSSGHKKILEYTSAISLKSFSYNQLKLGGL